MPIDRITRKDNNESFRFYFVDPLDYHKAMERAGYLESIKCPLRAWRVRMNLDGIQPTYLPPEPEEDEEIIEKPKKTYVRIRNREIENKRARLNRKSRAQPKRVKA